MDAPAEASRQDPTKSDAYVSRLEAEIAMLRSQLVPGLGGEAMVELDDARVLQDAGIYRYHHPLESAAAYQERLRDIETRIAELVRGGAAIERSELFTFNNSLVQGKKLSNDLAKLMLRAYNAEADNAIRSLKAGNAHTAKRRLESSRTAIARLGSLMEMKISEPFHELRLEEIELTSDWLIKKQVEREEAREERARLREERRVQKELEDERARLDKERSHLVNALSVLRAQGEDDPELEARLATVDQAIEQNDFRAANIRAGYIYVISNVGAFGEGVVKIGLTRRLDPLDRIAELSGASVPFRFDVHALFFSENAVTLENDLHKHFAHRALNQANSRKEFFFARPAEVREVLLGKVGNILEFVEDVDATEYQQSVKAWPEPRRH
ncbi:hypothetical protein M2390_000418 [Mycetocola sp. BIGb0189]|nr:DUF4041 domain-containing protein [Mycetocola sp. BIGb0189]MCS4275260.1 hypothetical protein [Mycetocola sp. BIGb0189]